MGHGVLHPCDADAKPHPQPLYQSQTGPIGNDIQYTRCSGIQAWLSKRRDAHKCTRDTSTNAAGRLHTEGTIQEKQEQELARSKRLADLRAARDVASADDTATEFRTCLNRHAYDNGSCEDKLKRCHSPARRLSMLNRKRAEEIASAFKEYA